MRWGEESEVEVIEYRQVSNCYWVLLGALEKYRIRGRREQKELLKWW